MDLSPRTALRLLWQVAPVVIKTAVLNVLRLSQNAGKQSLRTEVVVAIIRALIGIPSTIGKSQTFGNRDPGIKGPVWISKVKIPAPSETDTVDAVIRAVRELDHYSDGSGYAFNFLKAADIEAEWTGPRGNVAKDAPRLDITEEAQYQRLIEESPSETTVLYFHGGGYICMDPASHRLTTRALAKQTGGRVLTVRYRLAPQNPFPTGLLDALHAYLYLIAPPPGAFHTAVKPEHIVFAGDSAGGGLSTSLLLLLLQLQRSPSSTPTSRLRYNTTSIPYDASILPAGIALNSPYLDVTHSLPSIHTNARFDYLFVPPAKTLLASGDTKTTSNQLTTPHEAFFQPIADSIWPASPPRVDLYAPYASLVVHPLVSPVTSTTEHWEGSPPVWMCMGEEMLLDAGAILARTISRAVPSVVQFLAWEGMPHVFCAVFPVSVAGKECMREMGRFVVDVTLGSERGGGSGQGGRRLESGAWWYDPVNDADQQGRREVSFEELVEVGDEEVQDLLRQARARAMQREVEAVKAWEARGGKARL